MTMENEMATKSDDVSKSVSPGYVRVPKTEVNLIGWPGVVVRDDGPRHSTVNDEQTSEWHLLQASNGTWHKGGHDQKSVISRLCSTCNLLFKDIINSDEVKEVISSEILRKLDRSRSRIVLWCRSHDVLDGGLDKLISESRILRQETIKLLVSIARTIIQRLVPALHLGSSLDISSLDSCTKEATTALYEDYEDYIDYESDSSQDSAIHTDDSLGLIVARLDTDSRFLMDLDSLIRVPPLDSTLFKKGDATSNPQITESINPFLSLVQGRFPLAEFEVAHRLASANLERLQRCTAERQMSSQDEENDALHAEIDINQGKSAFDSGIGSSLRTGTSGYAETVMVYENKGRSVSIPPMPREAQKGKFPFDCVACGQRIRVMNNSEWKKHLYSDLKPWICLDPECSHGYTAFATRSEWLLHLGQEHAYGPEWDDIRCPLCRENTGSGMSNVTRHLATHMEELSLSALPKGDEDEADNASRGSRPDSYTLSIDLERLPEGISNDPEHTRDPPNDQKKPPDSGKLPSAPSSSSEPSPSVDSPLVKQRFSNLEQPLDMANNTIEAPKKREKKNLPVPYHVQETPPSNTIPELDASQATPDMPTTEAGHIQTRTLGRRFVCPMCQASFTREDNFRVHAIKQHRNRNMKPSERSVAEGSSSAPSSRVSRACGPCAAARVKCEDIKPCKRCVSRNLSCIISNMRYTAPSVNTSRSQIKTQETDGENTLFPDSRGSGIGQWKYHGPDQERLEQEKNALEKETQEAERQMQEFNKQSDEFIRLTREWQKEADDRSST